MPRRKAHGHDMYPGLNDLGDALDALPSELIRHLTLLREIEAKCVGVTPRLAKLISNFLDGSGSSGSVSARQSPAANDNHQGVVSALRPEQGVGQETKPGRGPVSQSVLTQAQPGPKNLSVSTSPTTANTTTTTANTSLNNIPDASLDNVAAQDASANGTTTQANRPAPVAALSQDADKSNNIPNSDGHSTNGSASATPAPADSAAARSAQRSQDLANIRALVRELVPCLEEKMHVAGAAAETVKRLVGRIDYDYSLIINTNEIPAEIQTGEYNGIALHPAIISGEEAVASLLGAAERTATSSRSESRREAMAAKRAAQESKSAGSTRGGDGGSGSRGGGDGSRTDEELVRGYKGRGGDDTYTGATTGSSTSGRRGASNSTTTSGGATKRRRNNNNASAAAAAAAVNNSTAAHNNNNTEYSSQVASANSTPEFEYDAYGNALPVVSNGSATGSSIGTTSNPKLRGARKAYLQTQQSPEPEPTYCYCEQVSYGEMVACDGPDCKREWFHLPCIGLAAPPKGQWFCDDCATKIKRKRV